MVPTAACAASADPVTATLSPTEIPNLGKTIETYEKAADAIAEFTADERTMTQYIIGAVSDLDVPMNPAAKGLYSLSAYMTGLDNATLQRERDELLAVTEEDIRALSAHIRAFMQEDLLCVVGTASKVKEEQERFLKVENLFEAAKESCDLQMWFSIAKRQINKELL